AANGSPCIEPIVFGHPSIDGENPDRPTSMVHGDGNEMMQLVGLFTSQEGVEMPMFLRGALCSRMGVIKVLGAVPRVVDIARRIVIPFVEWPFIAQQPTHHVET